MVAVVVVVIVLLQLHASDTLREENEKAAAAAARAGRPHAASSVTGPQPQPQAQPQAQPPHESKSTSPGNHQSRYVMSRQDEDLLDLMVRIAETPQEWDRIHRVLSLIGKEQKLFETTENYLKTDNSDRTNDVKNLTDSNPKTASQNKPVYNITSESHTEVNGLTTSTTLSSLTVIPDLEINTNSQALKSKNIDDTDAGWPDFEEAVVKKVKTSHADSKNDILQSSWLDDDWLDPNWNEYLDSEKIEHQTSYLAEKGYKENLSPPTSDKKPNLENGGDVPRSRLYRDPKILEFHLKDVVDLHNNTVEHNSTEGAMSNSSSGRGGGLRPPMFVYHRVTTSPRERERRGNSAIIAVSVVRQSQTAEEAPAPPTTSPPPHPRDQMRRIQNPIKDSLPKHQRKHPHWRQEIHWKRNRGSRHHHTHSHH